MSQLDPQIGEIYKHFKGNLYQVTNLAIHSETGRKMVVYQALYGDFATYVRDFDEFTSDVDYEKYPECTLRFRFTLVPKGQLRADAGRKLAAGTMVSDEDNGSGIAKAVKPATPVAPKTIPQETVPVKSAGQKETTELMMDFFDERSFIEKDKILSEMKLRPDLTDAIIDNLAAAIDVVIDEGPIDDRFAQLRTCVATRARFEDNRLRN